MIYQIFKKNGEDFILVYECEDENEMLVKISFLRVDGSEYKAEANYGSTSTILGV